MSDPMFVRPDDGPLVELHPEGYLTEAELQALVAQFPDLLPAAGINSADPRRFVLVRREAGLSDSEQGGARWWIDHLFLDQDAIPTLVEVKRASDTRIRREVVGQMLDYAAWALTYWSTDRLRGWFEEECAAANSTEADHLATRLGVTDPEAFWVQAKTNLQAGRIRMLFVADVIPLELRRVVEFLNQQFDPAEVLAVEIAQYRGTGFTTFVPRVLGQTEKAQAAKAAGRPARPNVDIDASLAELTADPEIADMARAAYDWARDRGLQFHESRLPEVLPTLSALGTRYPLFSVHSDGQLHLPFAMWKGKPVLGDEAERRAIAAEIGTVIGTAPRSISGIPTFPVWMLRDPEQRSKFLAIFDRVIERLLAIEADEGKGPDSA